MRSTNPLPRLPDAVDLVGDLNERIRALETGAHPTPADLFWGWGRNFRGWRVLTPTTGTVVDGEVQWQVLSDVVFLRSTGAGVTTIAPGGRCFRLPPQAAPASPIRLGRIGVRTNGDVTVFSTGVISGQWPVG